MRILIFIALLCAAAQGRGQIYINSYRFGAGGDTLILDDVKFPNADAAYSFRKLRSAYTGDCIIVRRSSGSPALDTIGFVNNYLDTATLKTFCAGVNCFVTQWYDQSGFNRHMKQATDASQPQIVTSGVLEKDGNFVALKYDGTNDELQIDSAAIFNYSGALSFFVAIGTHTGASNDFLGNRQLGEGGFAYGYRLSASRYQAFNVGFSVNTFTSNLLNKHLAVGIRQASNNWDLFVNNTEGTDTGTNGYTSTTGPLSIGSDGNGGGWHNGKGMEYIFYKSDKSTDRTGIQTNINNFYSIY